MTAARVRQEKAGDLFMVVGMLGTARLQITTGCAVAAAAATQYWQASGMDVEWFLRDDVPSEQPVLVFTHTDEGTVHVTRLVPGMPVSSHPVTCCGARFDPERVCTHLLAAICGSCHRKLMPQGHDRAE